MWFIGVEVEQDTSAPPPKKNPGSAPVCQARFFLPVRDKLYRTASLDTAALDDDVKK